MKIAAFLKRSPQDVQAEFLIEAVRRGGGKFKVLTGPDGKVAMSVLWMKRLPSDELDQAIKALRPELIAALDREALAAGRDRRWAC